MKLEIGEIDTDYARWLKSYMRHIKYKEVSDNTLILYTRILNQLQLFILEEKPVKLLRDIDREFFLDFVEYREERSKMDTSLKRQNSYISLYSNHFLYISVIIMMSFIHLKMSSR